MKYYKIDTKELKDFFGGDEFFLLPEQAYDPNQEIYFGGVFFAKKTILAFLNHGTELFEVTPIGRVFEHTSESVIHWLPGVETFDFFIANSAKLKYVGPVKEKLDFLVKEGADIHVENDWPVKWAVEKGDLELTQKLIDLGANVKDSGVCVSLFSEAIKKRNKQMVNLLLENGLRLDEFPFLISSPFSHGDFEFTDFLISKTGLKREIKNSLLEVLYDYGLYRDKDFLKFLNKAGINPIDPDFFIFAARRGDLKLLKFLVRHGVDPNLKNGLALKLALEKNHIRASKFLIKQGVQIGHEILEKASPESLEKMLRIAVSLGDWELVQSLIAQGVNVNTGHGEPLILAINKNNLKLVQFLLNHGADVNCRDGSPLCLAVRQNNLELVELLLKHGADVNCRDGGPLYLAVIQNNLKLVELLLKHGADARLAGCEMRLKSLIEQGSK